MSELVQLDLNQLLRARNHARNEWGGANRQMPVPPLTEPLPAQFSWLHVSAGRERK
jgi:hypothetical protein